MDRDDFESLKRGLAQVGDLPEQLLMAHTRGYVECQILCDKASREIRSLREILAQIEELCAKTNEPLAGVILDLLDSK